MRSSISFALLGLLALSGTVSGEEFGRFDVITPACTTIDTLRKLKYPGPLPSGCVVFQKGERVMIRTTLMDQWPVLGRPTPTLFACVVRTTGDPTCYWVTTNGLNPR
jgi:hypothetical protein